MTVPAPPVESRHLALVGPTASGKSALAHELARRLADVELVSVDSMQVYRGMDVGTAKPTPTERAGLTYHLLDVADPADDFTVSLYQAAAAEALAGIEARGHRALLVGGTGLYLRAVVDELRLPGRYPEVRAELDAVADDGELHRRLVLLDPVAAARMEPTNRRRIVRALEVCLGSGRPFSASGPGLDTYGPSRFDVVALRWARPALDERIATRYRAQLAAGFLDEVAALAARPTGLGRTARQALGYRELLDHVAGRWTLDEAVAAAVRRTRRFARRQERWFRRDGRIRWLDIDDNPMAALPDLLGEWTLCT